MCAVRSAAKRGLILLERLHELGGYTLGTVQYNGVSISRVPGGRLPADLTPLSLVPTQGLEQPTCAYR